MLPLEADLLEHIIKGLDFNVSDTKAWADIGNRAQVYLCGERLALVEVHEDQLVVRFTSEAWDFDVQGRKLSRIKALAHGYSFEPIGEAKIKVERGRVALSLNLEPLRAEGLVLSVERKPLEEALKAYWVSY